MRYSISATGYYRLIVNKLFSLLHIRNAAKVCKMREHILVEYSPWFDAEWYLLHNLDVARQKVSPVEHFIRFGCKEGRNPGPFFSLDLFWRDNPSAKKDGVNPLMLREEEFAEYKFPQGKKQSVRAMLRRKRMAIKHREEDARVISLSNVFSKDWYSSYYLGGASVDAAKYYCEIGWRKWHDPCPEFDAKWYSYQYGLVGNSHANPVLDFEDALKRSEKKYYRPDLAICAKASAIAEARLCPELREQLSIMMKSSLWDVDWYAQNYRLTVGNETWMALHYLITGWRHGYIPSPEFDGVTYLKQNTDVVECPPLIHYIEFGRRQRRKKTVAQNLLTEDRRIDLISKSRLFDVKKYRDYDVSFRDKDSKFLARHYLSVGWRRGWNPSDEFKNEEYLNLNADVRRANVCPLAHYLIYGQYEGRSYRQDACDPAEVKCLEQSIATAIRKRVLGRTNTGTLMLVTHELSYTGAPLSMLKAAECLRDAGYRIIVIAIKDGPLAKAFKKVGSLYVKPRDSQIVRLSMRCEVAIVNTLVLYKQFDLLSPIIPTVWWVREPVAMLDAYPAIARSLKSAENVYAMSEYSAQSFRKFCPSISVIPHGIDDEYRGVHINPQNLIFAVIGTVQERKGQDLFVEAVRQMRPEIRGNARFLIVGHALTDRFDRCLRDAASDCVEFVDEIEIHSEMIAFYEKMTCAVITSREEPTSRVAIEAMMMGRPVVMSDHVGAKYLLNEKNGRMFTSGDVNALRQNLEWMIGHPSVVCEMEQYARVAYTKNNSISKYMQNLQSVLSNAKEQYSAGYGVLLDSVYGLQRRHSAPCRRPTVTIVIPVYNALSEVSKLIDTLSSARVSESAEVIFIDDCSGEDTAQYLREQAKSQGYTVFRNATNLGFVKTCNKGIRAAKGDVVILLNSDTMIPPSFVSKVQDCFSSDASIACASPIAVHSGWFDLPIEGEDAFLRAAKRLEMRGPAFPPFTPEGFCLCCRVSALQDVGLLDEIYGMGYSEEDDLVMRILRRGYRTVLIDNLLVYHKRHASFSSERRKMLFENNRKIFNARYGNQQAFIRTVMRCQESVNNISTFIEEGLKLDNEAVV